MDKIDELLYTLNSYAVDVDESTFGLPLYSIGDADHMGALRAAVIVFRDEGRSSRTGAVPCADTAHVWQRW